MFMNSIFTIAILYLVSYVLLMTILFSPPHPTCSVNFPPAISGAPRFRVNTGEESIYAFNVTDSDNFTVSVMGETPFNASLETDGTVYTFRWLLASPDNISVAFSAVDSLQARSVLNPQVEICACVNGGTCTLNGILDLDADPVVMNCECPEGIIYVCMYVCLLDVA